MRDLKIKIDGIIHNYSSCDRNESACKTCSLAQQCKRLYGSSLCNAFDLTEKIKPMGIYGNFKILTK